ncbi:bifunctional 2-polyprenyl-6-hydroxyphenol methylase/3-demethylubiquinol 3-O-methyltransferase UbiG [Paenibacillus sp. MSJ-34]|uniref:class I SAM-dependent methyltransferase n=1 Tax=Paenibacillus sp. MSJ-34 TaxID=2841529 RepID=UPI001C11BF6E|nr:class I SAM-dependent methyltransferase [Paenibacillus sp. MSJ-34]MBU5444369.1 class I SAM-dependent methyltransferase [Paenibacillus sp. MSJ-34]
MKKEIYLQMNEIESNHWWFKGRRRIVEKTIESLQLPLNPKILDIGCGTGGNLSLLSRFGEVTGIELEDTAIEIARQKGIGTIHKGYLPDGISQSEDKYDLIILLDVLEHIEDDLASLRKLKSMLTKRGQLIITVPAFPFLWSQHDVEHHHKRRYRLSNLKKCILDSGLYPRHITYYNIYLFPIISFVRILRRIIPYKDAGQDVKIPNKFINSILESLFSSERKLVCNYKLPFGVSLLAVVQNNENF